jgi:hypothetical protein
MKKKHFLFAAAAIVLAGCANDDMIGEGSTPQSGNQVIGFNMSTPAMTRADNPKTGDAAATALDNEFIVWGEKNENADGSAASDGNLVFKNYRVDYVAGTANTTLSNTENWEYVGIAPYEEEKVSPAITESKQTIKYWDLNASSYTFTAVSAKKQDITDGKVKITKTTSASSKNVCDKGYTIEIGDGATLGNIYVAERKVIEKPTGTYTIDRTADNTYGGNATLTFRSFQSKIRFGIYETVPGYKVVITGIKYSDGTNDQTHTATGTKTFGIEGNFVLAGKGTASGSTNTKYTVTYETNGKPKVEVTAGNAQDYLTTAGETWLSTTNGIATSTNKPTYDNGNGTYTSILPNPSNSKNLKLQIAYKLVSEDTGEAISFVDDDNNEIYRTVEVPADYCKWKSNYAYTYIFKISDKTAELYPITFDACVATDEIGNQETITEVSEPSITTYAVKSDGKTVVTGQEEYQGKNFIYASVVDNTVTEASQLTGNTVTLTSGTNVNLYTVTSTKGTNASAAPDITEKAVANCIANGKKNNDTTPTEWTTTDVNGSVIKVTKSTAGAVDSATVPAEDGTSRTVSALKWTATASTYYAVEYINGANKTYKIVKVGANE